MSSYTYEEKTGMRQHAQTLISDTRRSQTNGELAEHFGYASGFLADLPEVGVCTDEEAAEWKFQLRQAKDEASERLVDLD
ncbi:hypothetical protein [Pseudomonas sp. NMI542_15]|uniref:hypothetical protein n=1 Tax=Pseudomonas sp. NMI542_15 TaxID=2903148 RepID=UPI001E44DF97|nr:hypothetical protein [Pseudomonas sp. NMI542_15]MCE0781866.1 hypothetical protein [Pseudomonas sp. NMI542_15]